jgi:[NiFe] hydrogenase large subunit
VLVAYGKGHKDIKPWSTVRPDETGCPGGALFSTLGRTAARGIETIAIGDQAMARLDHGTHLENIKSGDTKTYTLGNARQGMGVGLNDVPRGRSGPLDQHRRQEDQELPVCGAVNLELRPARRQG